MNRILLGANYYPEDWEESLLDFDIEKDIQAYIILNNTIFDKTCSNIYIAFTRSFSL